MVALERTSPVELDLCEHAAELIARKSRQGQKALVIDWLHASC